MIGFFLVCMGCAVLAALLINPKVGTILIWPLVFAYPHLYMERLELLPWNIGVDDLFVCAFFVIVVIRRNLLGGVPFRLGLAFRGALAYLLIWAMANLSGWTIMPDLQPVEIIKPILKYVILVLFTYAMVHTIDTERDLKRASLAFVVGVTLGGVTVVLHQLFPGQMVIFTSEHVVAQQRFFGGVERAVGALASANIGCAVFGMVVLVAINLARVRMRVFGKVVLAACVLVLIVAMVLTESRTGAVALAVVLCMMAILGRSRVYACVLLVGIVGFILARPTLFLGFWERIVSTYNPAAEGQLGASAQTRVDLWSAYWGAATPQIWLLGQGVLVPVLQLGFHPHSTYLSALFVHGIGGVLWAVLFFGIVARRSLWLLRADVEPFRTIAAGVLWSLLAWMVAGITLDMLLSFAPRYVYLFYAVLIERSCALVRQSAAAAVPQA